MCFGNRFDDYMIGHICAHSLWCVIGRDRRGREMQLIIERGVDVIGRKI